MKKKAFRYFIIFFVVPLIVSIIIAIVSNVTSKKNDTSYNMSYRNVNYNEINNTDNQLTNGNNTFIYLSVFCFVVMGMGVLLYINKKEF